MGTKPLRCIRVHFERNYAPARSQSTFGLGTLSEKGGWRKMVKVGLLPPSLCFHGGKRVLPGRVTKTPLREGARLGDLSWPDCSAKMFAFSRAASFKVCHSECRS